MRINQVARSVAEADELPRLIQLSQNLFAASFFLMKLLPANFILERAKDAGLIRPGSTIIETTSGTFGLALAIHCALKGYHLILVSDPAVDESLKRRLEQLGAKVDIVTEDSCSRSSGNVAFLPVVTAVRELTSWCFKNLPLWQIYRS